VVPAVPCQRRYSDNKSKLLTAKTNGKKSSVTKVTVKFVESHMQQEMRELNRLKPSHYHKLHKMYINKTGNVRVTSH